MAVVFAGQELVDPAAAHLFLALMRLHHGLIHQLVDEVEPHIRNGGGTVQPALLLHLHDDVLDHLFFSFWSSLRASSMRASPSTSLVAANRTGMPAALA